jgi:hypothetical protein
VYVSYDGDHVSDHHVVFDSVVFDSVVFDYLGVFDYSDVFDCHNLPHRPLNLESPPLYDDILQKDHHQD